MRRDVLEIDGCRARNGGVSSRLRRMMTVGELVVVSGPPGAGKSTTAALLADRFDRVALVPGDDFFGFLRKGAVAPWLSESHEQNTAVIEAAAAAAGRLADYCNVIYDGVVGPWFLQSFLACAGVGQVQYVILLPPLDVCLRRVEARTGHSFRDLAAAELMWQEFGRARTDSQYMFRDDLPAAELARDITSRMSSDQLRYPRGA